MLEHLHTYEQMSQYRKEEILNHSTDHDQLNIFHELIMQKVVQMAIEHTKKKWDVPPASFSFFVMGSAGRFEQGLISDQDHGLVFQDGAKEPKKFFQYLGNEITAGLDIAGYSLCDGNVMASNPNWCRSEKEWHEQISRWIEEGDWESIRYLCIFLDARVLTGDPSLLSSLKNLIFQHVKSSPHLLQRLADNISRIKKGIGIFGQLLEETHGPFSGAINFKETVYFPMVNGVRLLAIKENITEPSTIERLTQLSQLEKQGTDDSILTHHRDYFSSLLNYRLSFQRKMTDLNYERSHYIYTRKLQPEQKKELKGMMKHASDFHTLALKTAKKGELSCE